MKPAGAFAPALTYFTKQFSIFLPIDPYKSRSTHIYHSSQFAPLYRTSSPLITVPKALPWQMKSTLIIKFSCSEMPYNAEFCKVLSAFSSIVFFLLITTLFANHFKIGQGILAFMLFIYKNIVFRYVEILLHSFSNRNKSILPAF